MHAMVRDAAGGWPDVCMNQVCGGVLVCMVDTSVMVATPSSQMTKRVMFVVCRRSSEMLTALTHLRSGLGQLCWMAVRGGRHRRPPWGGH